MSNPAFLASGANGGQGALIDPCYHTPYALQASAAAEHDFSRGWAKDWRISLTYEHQQGVHQYRRYEFISGFRRFFVESWGELRKVEWPSQSHVIQGTVVVLIAISRRRGLAGSAAPASLGLVFVPDR